MLFPNPPTIPTRQELYRELRATLKEYALQPRKSLGQHFLLDPNVLHQYARILSTRNLSAILEIGGGLGTLTSLLNQTKDCEIIVAERDPRLALLLERRFPRVRTINTDVLRLPKDVFDRVDGVVGNIPFEISSPLLFKLSREKFFRSGTILAILVQQEFAERMVALPGTKDYGRLSVNIRLAGTSSILARFGPGSFYPAPKVASAMVEVVSNDAIDPRVHSQEFQEFLTQLFTRRNRKTGSVLRSTLKHQSGKDSSILEALRSDPLGSERVKNLTPDGILALYELFRGESRNSDDFLASEP
ncbi:MAG TPA: 16S rRNA (adenine(1518)-N(6)/adenine(1519)-N(6))-dimethyltransferase RsmA [Candidatus Hodarchaeales archaeon]|nr:16S rRNA (adenine(1518)-N(6)/adenine(1519)-N(6))-dimethyltransferase RsmA [Candidatus Hodarchaeales archaeon]